MMYYIFKAPRRPKAHWIEQLHFEPSDFMLQQKSVKYGPIEIYDENELREIMKKEENGEENKDTNKSILRNVQS